MTPQEQLAEQKQQISDLTGRLDQLETQATADKAAHEKALAAEQAKATAAEQAKAKAEADAAAATQLAEEAEQAKLAAEQAAEEKGKNIDQQVAGKVLKATGGEAALEDGDGKGGEEKSVAEIHEEYASIEDPAKRVAFATQYEEQLLTAAE